MRKDVSLWKRDNISANSRCNRKGDSMDKNIKVLVLPNDPLSIYMKQGNFEQFIERYRYYADNLGKIYILNFDTEKIDYKYPNIILINKSLPNNKLYRLFYQIFSTYKTSLEIKTDLIRTMDGGNFIRGTIAGIAGKLTGKPVVISIHGYHQEFADKFGYKWYHNIAAKILEKITSILGDMFFVVDPTYIKKLRWKNISHIPNYVDCSVFKPMRIKKKWACIYVGALHPKKGIKYLVEALKLVRNEFPSAKFAIAGHGALEKEIRNTEGIDYLGPVLYKQLPKYYSQAKMFLTASLWESFCMPVIEAQACEIPIVAFDLFPFHDNTIPGKTSLLCNIRNSEEMAQNIIKLISDNNKCKKMGKAGCIFVRENFDKEKILENELRLIRNIIKSN